ncbi:MAG: hypothetical protein WD602_07425 [Actinomycetota bacterium]
MALKRPKLKRREEAQQAPAPASAPASGSGGGSGSGISTAALQAALGGSYAAPTGAGGKSSGISTKALGHALTSGGGSAGNRSVYSTRHSSYPKASDLNALPAKAGTRTGPRTTSYRIPLQRSAHNNVYDTVN